MRVTYLEAYDDSNLIVNHIKGEYEVWHEDLIPYHHAAIQLASTFDGFYISPVSHLQNTKADAIAAFAATLALPAESNYRILVAIRHLFSSKYNLEVSEMHITSATFEPRIGDSLSSIMPYMTYYPITLKRQLSFDEGLLIFIMISKWRHFSTVHMMGYSFAVYLTQRHRKYLKKFIMTNVVPISLV